MTQQIKPINLVANCIVQAREPQTPEAQHILEFYDDSTASLWITGYVIVPLETMAQHPHALARLAIEKLKELTDAGPATDPENLWTTPDKPHMLSNNLFLTPGWMQPETKGTKQ